MKQRILLAVLALAISACAATRKQTNLIDEVRAYNEGVRWLHYPQAAARVHPKERAAFVAELSSLAEELKISEWDLIHVERPDRAGDRAIAHVRYRWFRDSVGTVHETNTLQTCKRHGRLWLVTGEKRVRGEPMPRVDEPDPEEQSEETSDKPVHGADGGSKRPVGSGRLTLRQMIFEFR